jgi:predicted flap endonuclease-1-like 5' DNA nuclease
MDERQNPMTLALVGALAGTVTVVAFLMLMVMGGYAFSPAAFLAILIGLIVAIILFVGFHRKDEAPRGAAPAAPVVHAAPKVMAEAAPVAQVMTAAAPVAAPVAAPATGATRKPESLTAARGGKADDLKIIKGIGPKLEELCHKLGFYHFDQVANWTADEVAWVDENLEGFKGRVTRDRWVPQAKAIVSMGPTEFLRRLEQGEEF